jgi:hypothetical protein
MPPGLIAPSSKMQFPSESATRRGFVAKLGQVETAQRSAPKLSRPSASRSNVQHGMVKCGAIRVMEKGLVSDAPSSSLIIMISEGNVTRESFGGIGCPLEAGPHFT